jgi:SNF2 family DNA or RNA helicase
MGIKYFMITGDTSAKDRLKICNDFNNDEDYKIVLISLKAGGTGLNLVGADVVIHLDPWWNYSAQNQASDRAHRIGQTRTVEVIKLIAENSIEERVVSLQDEKKELVDKVISNDDSSIKKLSIKDLKSILNM